MHWLLGDETNKPPKDGQFFIYGGLIVPAEAVTAVHDDVQAIRTRFGLSKAADLKFTNKSKIPPLEHRALKSELLDMLDSHSVKFIASVVLQQVLANQSEEKYMGFAVNTITLTFHKFLKSIDGHGAIFIDRVQSAQVNSVLNEMSDNFQSGLKHPNGYSHPVNDRIVLFGMTNNNSSHLSSCADIVLGSFRYCVNAATGHDKASKAIASELMPKVDRLWWRERPDGVIYEPTGLRLMPVTPSTRYAQTYAELRSSLKDFSKQTPF